MDEILVVESHGLQLNPDDVFLCTSMSAEASRPGGGSSWLAKPEMHFEWCGDSPQTSAAESLV